MPRTNPVPVSTKDNLNKPFMWLVLVAGSAVFVLSAFRLQPIKMDVQFLLLAFVTIVFGSRIGVQIPHVKAEITVSDTFIFLILLLYGAEAAVLVAFAEALCSSMRFTSKWLTRFFNAGLLAFSTFVTASVLRVCFGPINEVGHGTYSGNFIMALFV